MRIAAACLIAVLALAAPAPAQETVRLAAPVDCLTNPGCGPGLAREDGLDASAVHVPLELADAGIRVMKTETARRLGVARISDLRRSWPSRG
jgi:hypothetical protein